VVLIGVGEMGGVFAKALLRSGHPVVPVTRSMSMADIAPEVPEPSLVLVTVAEADLDQVLRNLPAPWRERIGLVQNELLPGDWEDHGIAEPTVASVWFEKKPGQDVKVIIPTPIWGPNAAMLVAALDAVGIAARVVDDAGAMRNELVAKNLYILTANIGGLAVGGGTVAELWDDHRDLAAAVAADAVTIQESLVGASLDGDALVDAMVEAFMADPDHGAMGRSAPARLERAVAYADGATLDIPTMRMIQERL
jgi:hypothetical protein